jgi:hypothetical protein
MFRSEEGLSAYEVEEGRESGVKAPENASR